MRITARLVDTATGAVATGVKVDGPLGDLFALQDQVVHELNVAFDAAADGFDSGAPGFPAGNGDGHALINRSDRDAVFLEVGDRHPDDAVEYSDIDMRAVPDGEGDYRFVRKDGTPY